MYPTVHTASNRHMLLHPTPNAWATQMGAAAQLNTDVEKHRDLSTHRNKHTFTNSIWLSLRHFTMKHREQHHHPQTIADDVRVVVLFSGSHTILHSNTHTAAPYTACITVDIICDMPNLHNNYTRGVAYWAALSGTIYMPICASCSLGEKSVPGGLWVGQC